MDEKWVWLGCGNCGRFHVFETTEMAIRWMRRFHRDEKGEISVVVDEAANERLGA